MSGEDLRPIAPPTVQQRDALRTTLAYAATLESYGPQLRAARYIADADPLAVFSRLAPLEREQMARLGNEVLTRLGEELAGVELTSGSGGAPKRRVISAADVTADAALVARLLRVAGVRRDDRAAAVELTVTPLALAFLDGCEALGVRESTALPLTGSGAMAALRRLRPSVLFVAPSAVPALLDVLCEDLPRLLIYNGDRLSEALRQQLRASGVGVRSLYGLTETSALGVECAMEDGIHLCPEHAWYELRPCPGGEELVVTTLGFSMPLLRHPTGDRVRVIDGKCACGCPWPRIEVLGRLGRRFVLFEVECSVEELRATLMLDRDEALGVELDDLPRGRVRMTLHLPAALASRERAHRAALRDDPMIGYLVTSRLVGPRLVYAETEGRKPVLLADRRAAQAATDGQH